MTKSEQSDTRGDGNLAPGSVKLLLDGQQRISSLYGIIKGHAPKFFEGNNPDIIKSHWVPIDENLWKPENYLDFLAARRKLLAEATNSFRGSLLAGSIPEPVQETSILDRTVDVVLGGIASEDEECVILDCLEWIIQHGLPEGEISYDLTDPETGNQLAVIDLAWPNGLQEGLSEPVALLIDEDDDVAETVNSYGYRYFTNVVDFKTYVKQAILCDE